MRDNNWEKQLTMSYCRLAPLAPSRVEGKPIQAHHSVVCTDIIGIWGERASLLIVILDCKINASKNVCISCKKAFIRVSFQQWINTYWINQGHLCKNADKPWTVFRSKCIQKEYIHCIS